MSDAQSVNRRVIRLVVVVLCLWLAVASGIGGVGGAPDAPPQAMQQQQQGGDCGCVTIDLEERGPVTVTKVDKQTIKISYTLGNDNKSWTVKNSSIWKTPDSESKGWPGDFDDLTWSEAKRLQTEIIHHDDGVYDKKIKPYLKKKNYEGSTMIKSHNKSVPLIVTKPNETHFVLSYEDKTWKLPTKKVSEPTPVIGGHWVDSIAGLDPFAHGHLRGEVFSTTIYQKTIEDYITKDRGTDSDLKSANQNDETNRGIIDGPVESVQKIIKWTGTEMANGVKGFIDEFHWVMLSVPAPGEPAKPATWLPETPLGMTGSDASSGPSDVPPQQSGAARSVKQDQQQGGTPTANSSSSEGRPDATPPDEAKAGMWWPVVWSIYEGLVGLVVLPIAVSWIYAWTKHDKSRRERDARLKRVALTTALVVGGVILIPMLQHLVNTLAIGIVPSGEEFLAVPGDFLKLNLGFILGFFIVTILSGLIVVALLVLFIQWVLMYFVVAFFPLAAVCIGSDNSYLKPYGHMIVTVFVGLLMLKLMQALILRFIFELPISFQNIGGSILAVVVVIAGILLAFIYLPAYTTFRLLPSVVTTMGGSHLGQGGQQLGFFGSQTRNQQTHQQSQQQRQSHRDNRQWQSNGRFRTRTYQTQSNRTTNSFNSYRSGRDEQQTTFDDFGDSPTFPRRVRAIDWLGKNAKRGLKLRKEAKIALGGAKYYWSSIMPGVNTRGQRNGSRSFRNRMWQGANKVDSWWQNRKERYEQQTEQDDDDEE